MKKAILLALIISGLVIVALQIKSVPEVATAILKPLNLINKQGKTISERALVPLNYKREVYKADSFQEYIQNYKLKSYGEKVINYDGNSYFYQLGHIGILDISVPSNGLQQCADALIRLRSEYLWNTNQKDNIGFNFTSGHYCSWKHYAEGYRPKISGSKVTFKKTASVNHSKDNFYNYLNLIFTYSGTISLYNELSKIESIDKLTAGDMLIVAGSPGHVVMIADVIKNAVGDTFFLLLQGNTPAQSVHLLKNLENTSISPWYELKLNSEVSVPGYTFANAKYVRFK